MRWIIPIALAAGALACGGGPPDPEFTGPIMVEEPRAATSSTAVRSSPPGVFVKPKLVEIRADWCQFCRAAEPSIEAAYDPFQSKVDRLVLDVTNDDTTAESARIAEREGVGHFFQQYQGRTPTVGVFVGPGEGRLVHGSLEEPETLSQELAYAVKQFKENHADLTDRRDTSSDPR